jgi:hypothetical protein
MLAKELVAASTTTLVLPILSEGENYGYALMQRVNELSEGRVPWSEGMLYPVLHWMGKPMNNARRSFITSPPGETPLPCPGCVVAR